MAFDGKNDCVENLKSISPDERIVSLDVFRGLTMLVMVFANALSERSFLIENIPTWMRHAVTPDSMTFADMIWPAFAFIMGVSIPLAIQRRLHKNPSYLQVWKHVLIRSFSLMIVGITMGHGWTKAELQTNHLFGISMSLWTVLLFLSFFLIWIQYPQSKGAKRIVLKLLRYGGIVLLLSLIVIYREGEESKWMECNWWILGSMGWGYLVATTIYVLFRGQQGAMIGSLALLVLLWIGDREGVFNRFIFLHGIRQYVPFGSLIGVWGTAALCGTIIGTVLTNDTQARRHSNRIVWMLLMGAGLFAAGFLLRPLYGVSKASGTPSWNLYSCAISCVIFAIFYCLVDLRGYKRWATFVIPAGANPLLPYFLSRMIHPLFALLSIEWINSYWNSGVPGVVRTMIFSVGLILFSVFLTTYGNLKLRL